jgi:hypothetical protein
MACALFLFGLGVSARISRAATLVVTTTANNGPGSLRQALLDANNGDVITFSTSAFPPGAPVAIQLQSVLPTLNKNNVTIEASYAGVILDGSLAPAGTNGLIIEGDNNTVRGLTFRNFKSNGLILQNGASGNLIGGDRLVGTGPNRQGNEIILNGGNGVDLRGAGTDGNVLRGNFIGISSAGTFAQANAFNGIAIWQGASNNMVGGIASGDRNVISGNTQNGVWISGTGTVSNTILGNFIGTRADGMGPVGNGFSGVAVANGAQNTRVGDAVAGAGNLISGNQQNGIYLNGAGTSNTQVLGNLIGPNALGSAVIGQLQNGVVINQGASSNAIGNGAALGRNLISGNALDGVLIADAATVSNTVRGNYIGANLSGTAALPNGQHGVELTNGAHDNRIGGNRLTGQGNLLSGNANHGVVIHYEAHHNTISGNLIGPDATGTYSLGNHPFGGIDIAEGAQFNIIGGLIPGEGNLISGNQTDGIALFSNLVTGTTDNQIAGNVIGANLTGTAALPNGGPGVSVVSGSSRTLVTSNTVAYNAGPGVWTSMCTGNAVTMNSIYSNTLEGIRSSCLPTPTVTAVTTMTVTGVVSPSARVEVYTDDADEGQRYQGFTVADGAGVYTFTQPGGFDGPNVTVIYSDTFGNTSAFAQPAHVSWTILLYLNGDNDLEESLREALVSLAAAGPSPRANVLALMDGLTDSAVYSGTLLFDMTRGQLITIATTLTPTMSVPGELNLGDGQTLAAFVNWGRAYYPSRYTLLSIVDHGGGWAPGNGQVITNTLARRDKWLAGNSGLSWDFTDDYDYLDIGEIRQTFAAITNNGARPVDVVFFDVCLMGMVEVAYQIRNYATFFVSSQNIAWAPVGAQGRYVLTVQGVQPGTDPRAMADLLVDAYAAATPPNEHPFTVSAVDLSELAAVAASVSQLGAAISQTLAGPASAAVLGQVYSATQKIDYDGDLTIEPGRDGFVDLYDFAVQASARYTDGAILSAADAVTSALGSALVAEQHRSGRPWFDLGQTWYFTGAYGLSIFLPVGEDLELPITTTETSPITPTLTITRNVRLRDLYTGDQLDFVSVTGWDRFINRYYAAAAGVLTSTMPGPVVEQLLSPDVTPSQTIITLTGWTSTGITLTWTAADAESGVNGAALWTRPAGGQWVSTVLSQTGTSGVFVYQAINRCDELAVRASDAAGNLEPAEHSSNYVATRCVYLPLVRR